MKLPEDNIHWNNYIREMMHDLEKWKHVICDVYSGKAINLVGVLVVHQRKIFQELNDLS